MNNDDTAIAIINTEPITPVRRSILTISEGQVSRIKLLATMMADSQLEYSKMKPGDIFIKMMKGIEVGLEPVASMDLIDVIQGKPTLKPQGMLALAWGSGLMQSLSITDDGKTCTVKMQRVGSPAHVETFSMDDAIRMKTKEDGKMISLSQKYNWRQMPAVMRKWRAVSAACRIVFPDIIQGMYIPEELSPDTMVNDSGEIIEAQYDDVVEPEVQPAEVSWPSKNTVAVVMDWYRSKNISDPEIFKLAGVTAIDDGDGWRKYADAKAAINGIQAAFDAELAGKATPQDNGRPEVYSCLFTHQAYVVNGTSKYLVFANCNPSNPPEDFKPTVIRAYGRSTKVKSWLGDFVYEENKLAQYDKAKKSFAFTPMAIPVEFEYEQRTPEKGDKFLAATGVVGDDANF